MSNAPPVETDARRRLRGIALMTLSASVFSVMDALIKHLAYTYHPFQVAFFRSLGALVPALAIAYAAGFAVLRTRRPIGHLLRAVLGVATMLMFFYAFGNMKLADVVAIGFTGTLFMTALSVPLLGERVGWRRWAAVAIGFGGTVLVVAPGVGVIDPVSLIALAAALTYAVSMIVVRRLAQTESNAAIVFYFSLAATFMIATLQPVVWKTPAPADLALLCLLGVLGGIAQYLLVEAIRLAPVSLVAPFEYVSLLWSLGFGFFLFAEVPSVRMLTGAAVIVASGLYILHREALRARQAAPK
jgi:drug/metabolite transporter (DMT)-like permease